MVTPLEVMDGAIVSGNCVSPGSKTTTYMHQNNAVIEELFKIHGKEINFMGIVINPLMTTLKEKFRDRMLTVRQVKCWEPKAQSFHRRASKPTTDLMIVCQELENNGIKTVVITNEDAGVDGMSESLPDSVQEANAIVSTGNSNATVMLPAMDKTIGNLKEVERVCGGNVTSIQEDGRLLLRFTASWKSQSAGQYQIGRRHNLKKGVPHEENFILHQPVLRTDWWRRICLYGTVCRRGARGNANAFAPKIKDGEIVATIVCGDNYFVENMDVCKEFVKKQVEAYKPDILIAGPAFNAGRFGIACCEVCKFVQSTYGIPSITGLYWENPGVEMYKADCYIAKSANPRLQSARPCL